MSSDPLHTAATPPSSAHTRIPLPTSSQNQAQIVAVIVLLVVVSLIIGALYLAQATTNITTVRDIEQLQRQRSQIERDNEKLRADIARLEGIDALKIRAATLGYHEAVEADVRYLVVQGYTYDQATPIPTIPVFTPTPQDYEENFSGWLKRQFDSLRKQFSDWAQ